MDYDNYDFWKPGDPDPYQGMSDEERLLSGCLQSVMYLLSFAVGVLLCALLLTSCKSVEYVPVIEHHTDTLIQTKVQHDSIYINDSTVITEKGDTVKIEKWHTKYIEKQVHDTTYISKTDTIPLPYPVEKEVPAELTWWQQTRLHIADIVLWMLLLLAVVYALRRLSRK